MNSQPDERKLVVDKRPSKRSIEALEALMDDCKGVVDTLVCMQKHAYSFYVDHTMIMAGIHDYGGVDTVGKRWDKSLVSRYNRLVNAISDSKLSRIEYFVDSFLFRRQMLRFIRKYEKYYVQFTAQLQPSAYS